MKYLFCFLLAAAGMMAADASGTWTGTLTVRTPDGDRPGPARLELKQDGTKLTGTAGPNAGEQHPIENGKAENGTLTFDLPAGDAVMKFALNQEGDAIEGGVTREKDGNKESAKLAVKREK